MDLYFGPRFRQICQRRIDPPILLEHNRPLLVDQQERNLVFAYHCQ